MTDSLSVGTMTKYCVLTDENLLLVMRPYQIAAAERVLKRILVSELNRPLQLALGSNAWLAREHPAPMSL